MSDVTIGWIGVGNLGSGAIRRFRALGRRVHIYNRTQQRARDLDGKCITVAESVSSLSTRVDVLYLCVSDGPATDVVLTELFQSAPFAHLRVVANMATIGPEASTAIRGKVERSGLSYVECPVTGGPAAAEHGTLTCYLSCPPDVRAIVEDPLRSLCKCIHFVGTDNQAQSVKVLNNLLESINLWGAAEALAIASRLRMQVTDVGKALQAGRGASVYLDVLLDSMLNPIAPGRSGASLSIRQKDARLAVALAKQSGSFAPLTAQVEQLYGYALDELSDVDQTACFEHVLKHSGVAQ